MFNQFIKNINSSIESFPILSSNNQPPTSKESNLVDHTIQVDKIVEVIFKQLSNKLSQKLGEGYDEGEFKQMSSDLLKSKNLQNQLIDTKQRYNDLVNKSTSLYQQARKISSLIGEFIASINLFLESQQLLIPLKQIQKGINDLQADKVEKHMNYLIRIFQTNFEQVINKKIKSAESALQQQLRLAKISYSNLQVELNNIKNHKNQDQSKYFEFNLKVTALNQKIAKLNSQKVQLQKGLKNEIENGNKKEKVINEQQKQINRFKAKQAELVDKIRLIQAKFTRNQRNLRQQNSEAQSLNLVIEKLKLKQEEIVQQLQKQFKKKQAFSETLRKKLHNEKIYLEEKIEQLAQKNTSLETTLLEKQQKLKILVKEKEKDNQLEICLDQPNEDNKQQEKQQGKAQGQVNIKQKITLTQILSKLKNIQSKNKMLQNKLNEDAKVSVNREVLTSLFISYDDQSKEWAVRRNIKYQIYSLLGLNQKIPKVEQTKSSKWFGFF